MKRVYLIQCNQPISGGYCKSLYSIYRETISAYCTSSHIQPALPTLNSLLPTRDCTLVDQPTNKLRSCLTWLMTLIIMENKLVPEGCGLITTFNVVFTVKLRLTYFLFSNRDLLLPNVIQFFFCTSSLLPVINEPSYFCYLPLKLEINTPDIEYKSSLLRGNG
jgi:hypothetical protein